MLHRLFAELEQSAFKAHIASDTRVFAQVLQSLPAHQRIASAARLDLTAREKILERLQELASEAVDPNFANPRDPAIVAYLLILDSVDPLLAQLGAERALSSQNCWWTRIFANWILGNRVMTDSPVVSAPTIERREDERRAESKASKALDMRIIAGLTRSMYKNFARHIQAKALQVSDSQAVSTDALWYSVARESGNYVESFAA